jgi:hypothetical protein
MATLSTMKSRLADELARSDLTSQIADAINDAIAEHERERFWFNESRDKTFSTVADQRVYTASDASWISQIIEIDDLFVTVSGQNRRMCKEDPSHMELLSDSSGSSGAPYSWAYLDNSIQLYPIPDQAYTVRAVGHVRLTALASDAESNAWTTEAEQLIRHPARLLVQGVILKDGEGASGSAQLAERALGLLRAETSRRKTLGRIQATQF